MSMKETLKLHEEEEIDKIHMNENYEVMAWCEIFDISVVDLRKAVQEVGTSATKVKYYLEEKLKEQSNSRVL